MSNVCGGHGNVCCQEGFKPAEASVVEPCPVCGRKVNCLDPEARSVEKDETTYYFDRSQCLTLFMRDPGKYADRKGFWQWFKFW